MDPFLAVLPASWTGVVQCVGSTSTGTSWQTLAHGQQLLGPPLPTSVGDRATCYDVMIVENEHQMLMQIPQPHQLVLLPSEETPLLLKEVCSGIGCIGQAAEFLGYQKIASMDVNLEALRTQMANHASITFKGDINKTLDRCAFHQMPRAVRGTIACGFPCQPLSSQGDGLGQQDYRSQAFFNTIRTFWEHQAVILLLECVPKALSASYIQNELQRLGSAMAKDIRQTVINLHNAWPCRRTRWWCVIYPQNYNIFTLGDLPVDSHLQQVDQLIQLWPAWDTSDEEALGVREDEMAYYRDPTFGSDQRLLNVSGPAPCFLHSYANFADPCPCGCRSGPFTHDRLLHGGVRGFFVAKTDVEGFRYLHPKEAALLCTITPSIKFPGTPRLALAQIGQCAAPMQALWVLSHLHHAQGWTPYEPGYILLTYKAHLIRELYGTWPIEEPGVTSVYDLSQQWLNHVHRAPGQTVHDLCRAEQKLAKDTLRRELWDSYGKLPDAHRLRPMALGGPYMLRTVEKKAIHNKPDHTLAFTISQGSLKCGEGHCQAGAFIFQLFRQIGIMDTIFGIKDHRGEHWQMDDTFTNPIHIVDFTLSGAGEAMDTGITNVALDYLALQWQKIAPQPFHWINIVLAQELFQPCWNALLLLQLGAVLHKMVYTCLLLEGHWVLLQVSVQESMLIARIWDGLHPDITPELTDIISRWAQLLAIPTWTLFAGSIYEQTQEDTCGALAMLHLGHHIGLWTHPKTEAEGALHALLRLCDAVEGQLRGRGKQFATQEEQDTVQQLRPILEQHGVPGDLSLERATFAVHKIGNHKIQEALKAKNTWSALKALGSQPGHNVMWVRPNELEAQIKKRAAAQFKIHPSSKRKQKTQPYGPPEIDPKMLDMVDGSFVVDDDSTISQITMAQVGTNARGLAFAHAREVIPFLKEGKSLSMEALAILTTTPIPAEAQGILPVLDLRYPAIFRSTQEPILIDGSLIQLGDLTVIRKHLGQKVKTTELPTVTIKVAVFRDEWPQAWDSFGLSPVKNILAMCPQFVLCKGVRCGESCQKFHPPIELELDSVILDLWSRSWQLLKGGRASPKDAEQFQVLLRLPQSAYGAILAQSGQHGVYVEPRTPDGRAHLDSTCVLWIPGGTLGEAVHKHRTTDKIQALARHGHRYGLRVATADASTVHAQLFPEQPYQQVQVQRVYMIRPLPHGTQRHKVVALLSGWSWLAKPLQPCHSDSQGMGWLVGTETDPPAVVLPTDKGEVMVTLQREQAQRRHQPGILASKKTHQHLRQPREQRDLPASSSVDAGAASSGHTTDPWLLNDPWSKFRPVQKQKQIADDVDMNAPMPSKRQELEVKIREELRGELKDEIYNTLQETTEERFAHLETDLKELKSQGHKFENWFNEAAAANAAVQSQMGELRTELHTQKQQTQDLSTEIRGGFSAIKAMFDTLAPSQDDSAKRAKSS